MGNSENFSEKKPNINRSREISDSTSSLTPAQELDAVRRHICQILGFDYALIDIMRGDEFLNLLTFKSEDSNSPVTYSLEALEDLNNEPLLEANSLIIQESINKRQAYIGSCKLKAKTNISNANEIYHYLIIPIAEGYDENKWLLRGVLRLICFDTERQIDANDKQTLKIVAQHLASRLPNLALQILKDKEGITDISCFEFRNIALIHTNRVVRRRMSRTLSANYKVHETDDIARLQELLTNTAIDLILVENSVLGANGEPLYKLLKQKPQSKYIPLIVISSAGSNKIEGLNDGADDCIDDNCIDAELVARVRTLIRSKKNERELATQLKLLEDYTVRLEQLGERERQASLQISRSNKQLEQLNKELSEKKREAEIRRNQDNLLHRISTVLRQSFSIEENIAQMLEHLAGWFQLDCCFVVLPDDDEPQDSVRQEYCSDPAYSLMDKDRDLELLDIFSAQYNLSDDLFISDVMREKRIEPFKRDILSHYHIYSLFYLPITYEGKLQGILGGHKCESEHVWSMDNQNFLRQVADQLANSLTNARLYRRVERQATTDGLTLLFNHRTGQEKLAEQLRIAERYGRNLCVIMLDVDHFKSINDTYGHPVGDSVLKAVSHIIKRDCRDVDIPVRYGGEEFLIVLPEINQEGATVVAERLRKTLNREIISHDDIQLSVTASLGIACYPDDAETQHQLLELADKALYMSKRMGRNQVHIASELQFKDFRDESPEDMADEQESTEEISNEEKKELVVEQTEFSPEPKEITKAQTTFQESVAPTHTTNEVSKQTPIINPSPTEFSSPTPAQREIPEQAKPATKASQANDDGLMVPEVVETVKKMAGALYSKSEYNKVHHLETARFAEMVAKVLGLSNRQVEQIRVASLLHDVGLLHIPEDIINKQGQVTADELKLLMQHPTLGAEMLRSVPALKEICEILEHHHECWDGTGYPRGLKGDQIPLAARIVSIVDAYHAMISDRPYRGAMPPEKAKRVLKSQAGSQFDPFLVDIFLAVLTEFEQRR